MKDFESPFPAVGRDRKKQLAAKILLRSLLYAFALFGLLFIVLLFVILGILRQDTAVTAEVPDKAVLVVDFDEAFPEVRADDLFSELSEKPSLSFYDLLKAVNVAALDNRVKALVGTVSVSGLGLAQIQELRAAVAAFRKSGKPAYLYSSGFGSFGNGTSEYYLATAFDKIVMQPGTEAGITGIGIEVPFVRGLLDKIGVTPEFYARHEYKNAMTSLTEKTFTPQYKNEMTRLGRNIFEQMTRDIAAARKIDEEKLLQAVNSAPLSAEEALSAGLIDETAYKPALIARVIKDTGGKMINVTDYSLNIENGRKNVPTVAFLVLDGVISSGQSVPNPFEGEAVIGADTVAAQLEDIIADKNIRAVILRINSPGGSYAASSEIWYAISHIKETHKLPVVVSMGDYAASGGYFVSLAGDYLLAEPSTLTGSIGVLGGKMVLSGLWKKLDVNWQEIKFGDNAGILSPNRTFSAEEKAVFDRSLDNIYADFTAKTAEARGISPADMDKLARGRVWTGEKAVEFGLADALGGIEAAIAKAKELGGISPGQKFNITYYPKRKTLQEKLAQVLQGGPKISVNKVVNDLGFRSKDINMIKRLGFDAVLPPFTLNY